MNIKRLLNKIRRENSLDLANFNYRTDSNGLVISELKNTLLTYVIVPDGVTEISKFAFAKSRIANVSLPNSLIYIDDFAFDGCESLELINIPESVTYIGESAFRGCVGLKGIKIPKNVLHIGATPFSNISLQNVIISTENKKYCIVNNCLIDNEAKKLLEGREDSIIPNDGSVMSVGYSAFACCEGLSNITIPESITTIDDYAFKDCVGLKNMILPNSVKTIGTGAFAGCENIEKVKLGGIDKINSITFYECKSITNLEIPVSVKSIGSAAFRGCASLSAITLPNSTKTIGEYAFAECANIESITIPESIVCIGHYSFDKCDKLTSVRFVNTNGWYLIKNKDDMTGMAIDVTDPIVNAYSLRGKYKEYYLKRIDD